jgi:hypothetical protein
MPVSPAPSLLATRRLRRAVKRANGAEALAAVVQHADPNVLVPFRWTPASPVTQAPVLFWALQRKDTALIEALLEARASLDLRVRAPQHEAAASAIFGFTALDAVTRPEDLLRLLRAGFLMHQAGGSDTRDMVLHVAAANGWIDVIKWVIVRCPGVDVRNARGQTPLHAAVRQAASPQQRLRTMSGIRLLCAAGCKLNARDSEGRTVVQLALLMCPELLPVLIECGASLDTLTDRQQQRLATLPVEVRDRMTAAASVFRLRHGRPSPMAAILA